MLLAKYAMQFFFKFQSRPSQVYKSTPTLRNPTKDCNDLLHIPIYWIEVNTFLQ